MNPDTSFSFLSYAGVFDTFIVHFFKGFTARSRNTHHTLQVCDFDEFLCLLEVVQVSVSVQHVP